MPGRRVGVKLGGFYDKTEISASSNLPACAFGLGDCGGPNFAFVFFGFEEINNSGGSVNFAFDPARVYVQQASQDFLDSGLSVYAGIFGPFAIQASTLTPGQDLKFLPVAQNALVVSTVLADDSTEANQTAYFLRYNRQPTDPLILMVKSDALRTSWPNTQDCLTITLK
jgi:hypothetical protein